MNTVADSIESIVADIAAMDCSDSYLSLILRGAMPERAVPKRCSMGYCWVSDPYVFGPVRVAEGFIRQGLISIMAEQAGVADPEVCEVVCYKSGLEAMQAWMKCVAIHQK